MDSQVLEPKKQELENFIQGNPDGREVKGALAVKWSLSGISYRQIRKLLNVSLGFISKWNKKFLTWGVNGLKIAYKEKPSYLSQSAKEEIFLRLNHKKMWDFAELAIHIESKYDILYQSQESYYSLLKSAKISGKKSQKRNPQGSSKLVSEKKQKLISI
jgi:putative transposase